MKLLKMAKSRWKIWIIYMFITSGLVSVWVNFLLQKYGAENRPPIAYMNASSVSGQVPHTVIFDGSASYDPEGRDIDFYWYIDNQLVSKHPYFRYLFNHVGIKRVELVIKDEEGRLAKTNTFIKIYPPTNLRTVRDALQYNKYKVGWAGPNTKQITYYSIQKVDINNKFILITYNYKHGNLYALVLEANHKLFGTWVDDDGEGLFEVTFDANFDTANGWWSYGGGPKKYKFGFMINMDLTLYQHSIFVLSERISLNCQTLYYDFFH